MLQTLSKHKSSNIRFTIAGNNTIQIEILQDLLRDKDNIIATTAVRSPKLLTYVLDNLMNHPSILVWFSLAININISV